MVVFVFMKLARPTVRLFSTSTAIQESERVTKRSVSIDSIKKLHAHLIRNDLHKEPSSISEVVRSYALSPPYLDKARLVFYQIKRPTFLVWNHMIRGLSQSDQPSEAIRMYIRMYHQGLSGNNLTFIFVFKACGRVPDIVRGQMVHVHALKLGFQSYLFVSNALIHMYASCRDLDLAQKVFDRMEDRDIVSWNSLMCGFAQHSSFNDVLRVFEAMQSANVKADSVTMVKVILACTYLGEFGIADAVVKYIEEHHVGIDVYLGNTMIDMYGRRGLVNLARQVFDRMPERNIVSWNAMTDGLGSGFSFRRSCFSDEQQLEKALECCQLILKACISFRVCGQMANIVVKLTKDSCLVCPKKKQGGIGMEAESYNSVYYPPVKMDWPCF
ncbi:hypothetical protein FEM48_Zijuj03G0148600 [Ziziphus jujuba var. spinosa]|uniref:Pentatricopeptide repeat-containing protein n=1 Tax=Ziziphus jujuba var. spinosa TaxID=714518 RepID=A0A978VQY6_ZIZJJ|nr:hypothetical protein FEM48_Zijuj03G0148600 [Ziziphus jujuba var. spinosa]